MDYNNRIELFRRLTLDELRKTINTELFESLLDRKYDSFVSLCNYIRNNKELVSDVSIYILENGELHFDVSLNNGTHESPINEKETYE